MASVSVDVDAVGVAMTPRHLVLRKRSDAEPSQLGREAHQGKDLEELIHNLVRAYSQSKSVHYKKSIQDSLIKRLPPEQQQRLLPRNNIRIH